MSKAVRIREHLYQEIEKLALSERRSIIGQLEILLEQALKMEGTLTERAPTSVDSRTQLAEEDHAEAARSVSDPQVRTDFKR